MKREFIAEGGIIDYEESFLPTKKADELFNFLINDIKWEQKYYKNYKTGEMFPQPRLTAWFADNKKMNYSYSGVTQAVQTWNTQLLKVKNKIEELTKSTYNSVLLNLYRNGQDSVGFHADDEKEIEKNSSIASLSLGESRLFLLKQYKSTNFTIDSREYYLSNGSLLVMSGTTQQYWKHSIPKDPKVNKPRINLTFRKFII